MTRREAILFLGGNEDELLDSYESHLFVFKHYFLTKPVVSKLYSAQFKKMILLRQAAETLEIDLKSNDVEFPEFSFENNIVSDFQLYEKLRADIKMWILNSNSVNELIQSAEMMLKVQSQYIDLWPDFNLIDEAEVLIGKEPDPMELLKDLKEISSRGINRFEELTISQCETQVTLFNEWKRLSLLSKKELEWKKISSVN